MSRAPSGASFQRKLTWAFLIVGVIPLLICLLLLLNIFRLSLVRSDRSSAESQLNALEGSLSALLSSCDGVLSDLSGQRLVADAMAQEGKSTLVYNALYNTAAPYLKEADFSLYDASGALLYTTGRGDGGKPLPVNWGLLWAARQKGNTVFRAVSPYDAPTRGAMELCRAITLEGQTVGYAVARLSEDHLTQLFTGRYTSGSNVLLLDPFWDEVYSSPAIRETSLALQLRSQLLEGRSLGAGGEEAYSLLREERSGFLLILQRPRPMAGWVSRLFSLAATMSVLLCLTLSLAAALWFSRQLFRPIRSLNDAMAAVEEGDLEVRMEVTGTDELSQLSGRFNRMTQRLGENLEDSLLQQRELSAAQVRMMQAQLNPHFLYNTLDTLKWLGKIHDAPQVSTISADLAHILRQSISGGPFVPLSQELLLLEKYVEIQKIRFPGKFTYTIRAEEDLKQALVPRLMLQPLVENAIIHGFEDGSHGTVTVSVRRAGEDMVLTVTDDGCGMSPESRERFLSRDPAASGHHLGLYNVDAILRLHYGPDRGLRLLSHPGDRGTCIQAILPIREEEGGEAL